MPAGATIGALRFVLGADTAEFERGMKSVEGGLKRAAAVGAAVGAALGTAFLDMAKSLADGVSKSLEAADKLGKMAQSAGIAVEQLSALKHAADLSDVSLESLTGSLEKLGRNMTEAVSNPLSTAGRTLQALGISAVDAAGQLRPVNDVVFDIADKFSKFQDSASKTALAINLFGRSGADLIPLLNQGRTGLQQATQEAERYGLIVSSRTARASEEFNDTLRRLQAVQEGYVQQITARLLPSLNAIAGGMLRAAESSATMTIAVNTVVNAWNILLAHGIALKAVFDVVGQALTAISLALLALGRLDTTAALEALKKGFGDVGTIARQTAQDIRNLWLETVNFSAVAGKMGSEVPLVQAPVIASTKAIADAMRAAKDEARFMLDQIVNAPTETFVAKMAAIEQALKNGTITMRQFGEITRRVQKENQQHMLDLGSATATALTTIFGKSKAAGIAAAIINTAVGITKALATLPPPFSFAQAALVAAMGAAQIATIKSTNESGSGSAPSLRGSGGSGGGESEQGGPTQTLMVQGIDPGALFSGEAMRNLAEQLLQFQKDGGQVVLR
jgi:hypothetical protein